MKITVTKNLDGEVRIVGASGEPTAVPTGYAVDVVVQDDLDVTPDDLTCSSPYVLEYGDRPEESPEEADAPDAEQDAQSEADEKAAAEEKEAEEKAAADKKAKEDAEKKDKQKK